MTDAVLIPNRAVFKAQEVCELLEVQPYVLRSWEAEFPNLGVSKSADGPRVYRRADVAVVVRLKHLLFVEGLTLAGARRQLVDEGVAAREPQADDITDADVSAVVDGEARARLVEVREGLSWILSVLGDDADAPNRRAGARGTRQARAGKSVGGKSPKTVKSTSRSARPARSKPRSGRRTR